MKSFILFIFSIIAGLNMAAQVVLKGKLTGESKEKVQGAAITVKGRLFEQSVLSGPEGEFEITGLKKGSYTLVVSGLGYELYSEALVVDEKSKTISLAIVLIFQPKELQTVEVLGRNSRRYNSDYSFSATKIAGRNKDIPQAISTVTKELIADRQAFQLADAVKIASGVIPSSYYNQYAIRGISQNEEGQIINGMRTRQYYFLQPLTSNIERVEVLKGPASVTFSSADPGGSINLVTKKPLAADRKEISVSVGSFSTIRGTVDFTGPLNQEKTLLYRLNGAYQEARSFRDLIGQKSLLLSPSFSYVPNSNTAVNAEVIFSNMNGNLDRGQPIFGAVAGQTNLNSTPIGLNLGAPNDFFKSKEFIAMGNIVHKFNSSVSFNASYMKQTWTEDLQEHRTTNAFAVDTANKAVTSLASMQFVQRKQFWNIDNVNAYFHFSFNTGSVGHILLAGYDLNRWQKLKGGGQNAARGFLLKDGTVAASYIPANLANYQTITIGGQVLPRPNVNHFDLNNPSYTIRNVEDYVLNVRTALPSALTTTHAAYVQEQLQWRKITLLLSLRNEWFEDITNYKAVNPVTVRNSNLVPRVGITWAVTKSINLYGTYLEGFQPQSNTVTLMPNTGSLKAGAQFKPLISDLKEAGVKMEFWRGSIVLNAAIYEINQKNILINANLPAFPDSLTTRGSERSRGFEIDIAGFLLPNWQVNASYSYIDARITNEKDPALIGARKQNTPYNSANIWTRYNFPRGSVLRSLGAGLGMQHVGNRVPWFTRAFVVPAYTIFDLAIYYTPQKSNLQLAVNINNIFDKVYWVGAQNYLRLFPGAPRSAVLTATYRF